MNRIATTLVTLALVAAVHSDNVLKCYMCTSLSNGGCGAELTENSLQPVECTGHKMIEWQRSIEQHKLLNPIARLFEVDETLQHYQGPQQHMACAKMTLNIKDHPDVTIRTCQTAETEVVKPCKVMEGKLETNLLGSMEYCTLCYKEACNGTMGLSIEIFYILLSLLSTFVHAAFYHWA